MRGKTQFGFQVEFGNEEIDLSSVEQVVERSQTRWVLNHRGSEHEIRTEGERGGQQIRSRSKNGGKKQVLRN